MRKQSAQQTILTLLAWLIFLNFNNATPCKHHTSCSAAFPGTGKGMESSSAPTCSPNDAVGPISCFAFCAPHVGNYRIKKVVLDAGHGGKDPGCLGAASKEKHNALAIVLKLGALIREEYPEVQVIYTRETDVFVELNERAAIANRHNADLFISVHCNSISVSYVKGVETYVMGLHTANSNLEVAKRENASIFLEDNYQKNYGGYDPNSTEAHIFGSVWQSAYLEQSILFASYVQQFSKKMANRDDRGVKQAGFIVLHKTAMPAVLVEAGFLTNRDEERFIASEEGQLQIADAVFEAFRAYKAKMEGEPLTNRIRTNDVQAVAGAKGIPPVEIATTEKKSTENLPPTGQPVAVPVSYKTPVQEPTKISLPPQNNQPTASTGTASTRSGDHYADELSAQTAKPASEAGLYRIHLLSWSSRLDRNTGKLSLLSEVEEEQSAGEYHYFTGKFAVRTEAEKMLPELFNLGFRTAQIVQNK